MTSIVGIVIICSIIKAFYDWWNENRQERQETSSESVSCDYKAGTDRAFPHLDLVTTNELFLETNDKNDNDMEKNVEEVKVEIGTRELFMETLTKIGCQYELADEDDDDRIFFSYQGENFFAGANNDNRYVRIWDGFWEHVELYDVDELARLKKAINGSNFSNSVTTVYTIDEAGNNVDVHSKSTILFIPQIPDIENYLKVELNEFFCAHRYVNLEMDKLREQEKQ